MGPSPLVYSKAQIQSAVQKVAGEIGDWLLKEGTADLCLLSVLEGARTFTRDLVGVLRKENLGIRFMVYEVKVKGTTGTKLLEGRDLDLGGLDLQVFQGVPVLIVDDLVDSGMTLAALKRELVGAGAKEVRTAVLIRKWRGGSVPIDFCGLDLGLDRDDLSRQGLKDRWLYGYGMDLDGAQRDLDHVGWVDIKI